jgi:hypothetical protein
VRLRVIGLAVVLAISLVLALHGAAQAQESTSRARVAFVGAESSSTNQHFLDAFRQGLGEHGYVDGQNMCLRRDGPTAEVNAFRNWLANWCD